MAARGCGASRTKGGVYFECSLSPYGLPLENFIVDPPVPIDANEFGVTQIGVKLMERKGVWHVMDWVGSTHYPNVGDYLEEVRRLGLSRRVATTFDFKKLTSQSRILLLHSRAYIYNYDEYQKHEPDVESLEGKTPYPECPKMLKEHQRPKMETMCARLWYQDVTGGEESDSRYITRKMPSFEYKALKAPEDVKPDYRVAIFASFPITNLAVILDEEGGSHQKSMELAGVANIPVKLVEE